MILFLGYVFLWLVGSYLSGLAILFALSFALRKSDGMAAMAVSAWVVIGWLIICGISGVFAAGVYWGAVA